MHSVIPNCYFLWFLEYHFLFPIASHNPFVFLNPTLFFTYSSAAADCPCWLFTCKSELVSSLSLHWWREECLNSNYSQKTVSSGLCCYFRQPNDFCSSEDSSVVPQRRLCVLAQGSVKVTGLVNALCSTTHIPAHLLTFTQNFICRLSLKVLN